MAPAERTRRTNYATFYKAVADPRELSVTAVLTYPVVDLAGDLVRPEGANFAPHAAAPWVDLEHDQLACGWARKSLARPGEYTVRLADLEIDGATHTLPVGTTHFDPTQRRDSQVFALHERGALPGVSIEFRPVPGSCKSLGRSPLEPRDAYDFARVDVVRWSHCAEPVNPGALTVTKSLDRLASILSANKVGSEELDPTIKKALAHRLPARTVFRTLEKAMTDETPGTIYDDGPPGTPTVQAHYDVAQGLIDLCEQGRSALESSEHVKGKQYLLKLLDRVEAMAEDAKANGDKIDGELSGGREPSDDEPDAEPIETDDDGVMKSIRPVYRKAIKRFTLAEVQKATAPPADAAAAKDLAELKRLMAVIARNDKLLA